MVEYLDCLMECQRVASWVVKIMMAESSVMTRDASRAVKINKDRKEDASQR